MMKKSLVSLFCAIALTAAFASYGEESPAASLSDEQLSLWTFLPDPVAEVDGKPITKSYLLTEIYKNVSDPKMLSLFTKEQLQKAAEELVRAEVTNELLLAEAAKDGIIPSEQLVVDYFQEQWNKSNDQEKAQFENYLKSQNTTRDEFIGKQKKDERLQKAAALQMYVAKHISDKVQVSEDEAKKFFEDNKDKFKTPADPAHTIRASHVLINVPADAPQEDWDKAKAEIATLRKDIEAGSITFEEAAQSKSQCPSGRRNGSLGVFSKDDMVPEFSDAAFALEEGQISEPVKTQYGYHLIRRDASQKGEDITFDKVKESLENMLKMEKSQKMFADLVASLEKAHNVKFFIGEEVSAVK